LVYVTDRKHTQIAHDTCENMWHIALRIKHHTKQSKHNTQSNLTS